MKRKMTLLLAALMTACLCAGFGGAALGAEAAAVPGDFTGENKADVSEDTYVSPISSTYKMVRQEDGSYRAASLVSGGFISYELGADLPASPVDVGGEVVAPALLTYYYSMKITTAQLGSCDGFVFSKSPSGNRVALVTYADSSEGITKQRVKLMHGGLAVGYKEFSLDKIVAGTEFEFGMLLKGAVADLYIDGSLVCAGYPWYKYLTDITTSGYTCDTPLAELPVRFGVGLHGTTSSTYRDLSVRVLEDYAPYVPGPKPEAFAEKENLFADVDRIDDPLHPTWGMGLKHQGDEYVPVKYSSNAHYVAPTRLDSDLPTLADGTPADLTQLTYRYAVTFEPTILMSPSVYQKFGLIVGKYDVEGADHYLAVGLVDDGKGVYPYLVAKNGQSEHPETLKVGEPFAIGTPVSLDVVTTEGKARVFVNGVYCCEFDMAAVLTELKVDPAALSSVFGVFMSGMGEGNQTEKSFAAKVRGLSLQIYEDVQFPVRLTNADFAGKANLYLAGATSLADQGAQENRRLVADETGKLTLNQYTNNSTFVLPQQAGGLSALSLADGGTLAAKEAHWYLSYTFTPAKLGTNWNEIGFTLAEDSAKGYLALNVASYSQLTLKATSGSGSSAEGEAWPAHTLPAGTFAAGTSVKLEVLFEAGSVTLYYNGTAVLKDYDLPAALGAEDWTPCFGIRIGGSGDDFVMSIDELAVKLYEEPATAQVTFAAAGGTGSMDALTVLAGGQIRLPACAFTKTGHTAVGWTVGEKDYAAGDLLTAAESLEVSARYAVNAYRATFYSQDNAFEELALSADYGASYTLPAALTRTGYTFGGWRCGETTLAAGATAEMGAEDVRWDAVWTVNSYTVSFVTGTDETIAAATKEFGAKLLLPEPQARTGYTFAGWKDGENNFAAGAFYTVGAADVELTAVWESVLCTLTYDNEGVESDQRGAYDATVALAAAPQKKGYTFGGWKVGDKIYAAGADYLVQGDVTLTAVWTVNRYAIATSGEHAIVAVADGADYGETVTFTVTAEDGYEILSVKLVVGGKETVLDKYSFTMTDGDAQIVVETQKKSGCGAGAAGALPLAAVLLLGGAALLAKAKRVG